MSSSLLPNHSAPASAACPGELQNLESVGLPSGWVSAGPAPGRRSTPNTASERRGVVRLSLRSFAIFGRFRIVAGITPEHVRAPVSRKLRGLRRRLSKAWAMAWLPILWEKWAPSRVRAWD